jgi:hypothetical protein
LSIEQLRDAIAEQAPIEGCSFDEIWFLPEATEEQRSAAQAILDNWVDPPKQDWAGFVDALTTLEGFFAAVAGSSMAPFITTRMAALSDGKSFQGSSDRLIKVWNAAPPALDQTQRDQLTTLATAHGIPVAIDSDNLLAAI